MVHAPTHDGSLRGVSPVAKRSVLHLLSDRLDPLGLSRLIDEVLQDIRRRSRSAWAKNALTSFWVK